jgi:hypothetical protein
MSVPAHDLTTIELIVLDEAGGDNTLGNAYGAVQLYAVFQREEELVTATQNALLRLFDLGLVCFVRAEVDVGYTAKRFDLPRMSRDELLAEFDRDRNHEPGDGTDVWYDPTPQGEAEWRAASTNIPRVSGTVRRPWLDGRDPQGRV